MLNLLGQKLSYKKKDKYRRYIRHNNIDIDNCIMSNNKEGSVI